MATLLDRELAALGLAYEVIDVDTEEQLRFRYGDVVPVLLRDGRPVAKTRLSAQQLRRIVGRRWF
jgi:hypothetical protein